MTTSMTPEPFAESVGEAVQTSTMAVRLILAIADAVRRAAEERASAEKPLPPADQSTGVMAGELKGTLPPDIATALMSDAAWPQMAQQLMALQRAGVDMGDFLPRVGEVAVTVRDAVAANTVRIAQDGTGEWAAMLRETMPAGPVREAILASPAWPDIAATMSQLDARGVDVRQILAAAHSQGAGVDQAVHRVMTAAAKPQSATAAAKPQSATAAAAPSRDALLTYGPLTVGLDIPTNLNLADRSKALAQLGVSTAENERFVRMTQEAMTPALARESALLVNSRQWPLLAARMAEMADAGQPVAEHLKRLAADRSWHQGPSGQLAPRLVQATNDALRTPLRTNGISPSVPRVSTTAARAQSAGPTTPTATKGAAPAEPAVAPHLDPAPSKTAGRSR